MSTLFAAGTTVSESKSKVEIDDMLRKWKSTSVAIGEDAGSAVVIFVIAEWHVRFRCPMPDANLAKQAFEKRRVWYPTSTQLQGWIDHERKRRWRALLLTIKAKLVSVENGIEKFEEAFLAHLVIEGGQTVGQRVLPAVTETYRTGKVPNAGLLGSGT